MPISPGSTAMAAKDGEVEVWGRRSLWPFRTYRAGMPGHHKIYETEWGTWRAGLDSMWLQPGFFCDGTLLRVSAD
ncbi:hypothetical protein B2D07_18600 [Desulfococcus multivorans]|nr:hypothetical protein B2D07_18600 [Desulfococcus multivorans]